MRIRIGVALPLLIGLFGCGARVDAGGGPATGGGSGQLGGTAGSGGSQGPALARAGSAGALALAEAGTANGGSSPIGGTATVTPAADEPACPNHEPLNSHEFSSLTDKQQAFVGRWLQCSKQGIGPDDAAGIDIGADGQFTILVHDAKGDLAPGVGVLHQGRIVATLNDVAFEMASYTELSRMLFSDETPYRMYAFNTDFIGYDYIRVTADAVQ